MVALLFSLLVATYYGPPPCHLPEIRRVWAFEAVFDGAEESQGGVACARPCEHTSDCFEAPEDATATPTCSDGACVLECGELTGDTCPTGATCHTIVGTLEPGLGICMFGVYPDVY